MGNQYPFDITAYSSFVSIGDHGIYYADSSETISYPNYGNDNCFLIEENSFWFRHRNNCIIEMIKNFGSPGVGPIFDIGGGNGFVSMGLLNAGFDVVMVEPGPKGAFNAKKRGVDHVICATTHTAKFQPSTIPAIGIFDVVEHIEDDIGFLNHLWELLVPGGMLYLTVPAYQLLWSQEDEEGGHFRRYTLSNIKKKMMHSGFNILYSTYIFGYLPPLIYFLRTIPYKKSTGVKTSSNNTRHHFSPKGLSSKIQNTLHALEIKKIKKNKEIKIGGSCMLVGQKPQKY